MAKSSCSTSQSTSGNLLGSIVPVVGTKVQILQNSRLSHYVFVLYVYALYACFCQFCV